MWDTCPLPRWGGQTALDVWWLLDMAAGLRPLHFRYFFHCLSHAILSAASKLHQERAPAKQLFPSQQAWGCPGAQPFAPSGSRCPLTMCKQCGWHRRPSEITSLGHDPVLLGTSLETCWQCQGVQQAAAPGIGTSAGALSRKKMTRAAERRTGKGLHLLSLRLHSVSWHGNPQRIWTFFRVLATPKDLELIWPPLLSVLKQSRERRVSEMQI